MDLRGIYGASRRLKTTSCAVESGTEASLGTSLPSVTIRIL